VSSYRHDIAADGAFAASETSPVGGAQIAPNSPMYSGCRWLLAGAAPARVAQLAALNQRLRIPGRRGTDAQAPAAWQAHGISDHRGGGSTMRVLLTQRRQTIVPRSSSNTSLSRHPVVAQCLERRSQQSLRRVRAVPCAGGVSSAGSGDWAERCPQRLNARALSRISLSASMRRPAQFSDLSLSIVKLLWPSITCSIARTRGRSHFGLAVDDTPRAAPNRRFPASSPSGC